MTESHLLDVLHAAQALGEPITITPLCCCPNQGKPKDGYIVTDAGCRIHGLRSQEIPRR